MKKTALIVFALMATFSFSQDYYKDLGVVGYYHEFQENDVEVLYGDNVVLRKKPSIDARAIDTLLIGSEVTILKNTKEKITVNGRESNWYKVETNKGTGYIAGGLISMTSREFNGGTYLVITAGSEFEPKFRVRYLKKGEYYGKEGRLGHSSFQLEVEENKGLDGVEGMLTIKLFAESCGTDGGIHYIFNNGEKLFNAIHCRSVSDGGVFWFSEKLEFPEERGWGEHITYTREFGESLDDEMNITRSTIYTVTLNWEDGAMYPDVSEMDFDEGE